MMGGFIKRYSRVVNRLGLSAFLDKKSQESSLTPNDPRVKMHRNGKDMEVDILAINGRICTINRSKEYIENRGC